jgi:hypothetical protein
MSISILLAILAISIQWEPAPVKSAAPVQIFLPYIRNTIPVVISESKCIGTRYGGPAVRGNVMSISDRTVYNISIQADFTDYDGQVISSTGQTVFTPTVSMQRNPFAIGAGIIVDNLKDCTAKIVSWTRESSAEFLPLTVVSTDTNTPNEVIVSLRNDNSVPLKKIRAYAWSLDQYYSFLAPPPLNNPIAPGETITYTQHIYMSLPPVYMLGMGSADP